MEIIAQIDAGIAALLYATTLVIILVIIAVVIIVMPLVEAVLAMHLVLKLAEVLVA